MDTPAHPVEDPLKWLDDGLPDLSGYNNRGLILRCSLISDAMSMSWLTVYLIPGKHQRVGSRHYIVN